MRIRFASRPQSSRSILLSSASSSARRPTKTKKPKEPRKPKTTCNFHALRSTVRSTPTTQEKKDFFNYGLGRKRFESRCTLHPTPYTSHNTVGRKRFEFPSTLHPTPYTLLPIPYTLYPTQHTTHHTVGRKRCEFPRAETSLPQVRRKEESEEAHIESKVEEMDKVNPINPKP